MYFVDRFPGDAPQHECGIFGIWAPGRDVALQTYYALTALQHRGQESAGIACADAKGLKTQRGTGLVGDVFDAENLDLLKGHAAIGHVRYSTTGASSFHDAQPLQIRYKHGDLALAHNGNFVNASTLRIELEARGSIFQSTIDSEVFAHLIACSEHEDLEAALAEAATQVRGGYAIVFLTKDKLIALRDPNGIRPLVLGEWDGHYLLASESCAFDTLGAKFIRDVGPGEMITIDNQGIRSSQALPAGPFRLCAFEYIYFGRSDSDFQSQNTHVMRKRLGMALAKEAPVTVDIVCGVPDSSISAAIGYAEASGVPFEMALNKNRYLGRTFIKPTQEQREIAVMLKLNPVQQIVKDKRILLVDDSIVRGTTMRHIINLLKEVGAREVHVRISSPPYLYPCHYGIDTSARGDLIASNRTVDEVRQAIGADSLHYLSKETLTQIMADHGLSVCQACFDAQYPVPLQDSKEAPPKGGS